MGDGVAGGAVLPVSKGGRGRCAFFADCDGTEYVTLHAQRAGEIKRNTIIRPMRWDDDGLPVLA